jgi:hypothetical protein
MEMERSLESLPDEELLRRLADLLGRSRRVEADLVAHIGEVDRRRLFSREACPSMFTYCTEVLHLSEHEAYLRIAVARAAREHPMLLVLLAEGRLHLAGIAKLAPHLTRENRDALLERAVHRSKREIEELLAELAPRPDAPALMRKLPERPVRPLALGPDRAPAPAAEPAPVLGSDPAVELGPDLVPEAVSRVARVEPSPRSSPPQAAVIQPLAPARYRVQFTAGSALHDKLERLRALMRSEVPDGDLAAIIEKAVAEKLERLEARRHGATKAPRKDLRATDTSPSSRHIPAAVRRAVWERDGGRCRYVDAAGRRCSERRRLEYHHRRPFGLGGDRSPLNICLMCRAHNRYMAEQDYGRETMARHSRSGKPVSVWTDRDLSPAGPTP